MDNELDATTGDDASGVSNQKVVLVTQVELETLVARVEALEEALDVLVSRVN